MYTIEARFVACAFVVQKHVRLRRFLYHLGVISKSIKAIIIYHDKQLAITYTKNPKHHDKTKHIDTKYNFIRDVNKKKEVTLKYISIHIMMANHFTKLISRDIFMGHVRSLRLHRMRL